MITESQKKKLRKILEKISTPEEMKEFDMELLKKDNEQSTSKILEKIEKSKPEIKWDFVSNLIAKAEKFNRNAHKTAKTYVGTNYPDNLVPHHGPFFETIDHD